jgi:hypothetical protein
MQHYYRKRSLSSSSPGSFEVFQQLTLVVSFQAVATRMKENREIDLSVKTEM